MMEACHDQTAGLNVPLREADAGLDPFVLFERWYAQAEAMCAKLGLDPSAMTLDTSDAEWRRGESNPRPRAVLPKHLHACSAY